MDRVGQRVGSLEVIDDHGRTKRGEVVWRCLDRATGRTRFLRSYEVARLAVMSREVVPPGGGESA